MCKTVDEQRKMAGWMLETCIAGRTRLLNRVIISIFDQALRPAGLRNGQLTLLCMACYMGRVRPHELQDLLQMDASTVSRNVKLLQKRGWLRTLPAGDERTHYVALTPRGVKQIEKALPLWQQAQERATQLLGELGARSLDEASRGILEKIVGQAPDPRPVDLE